MFVDKASFSRTIHFRQTLDPRIGRAVEPALGLHADGLADADGADADNLVPALLLSRDESARARRDFRVADMFTAWEEEAWARRGHENGCRLELALANHRYERSQRREVGGDQVANGMDLSRAIGDGAVNVPKVRHREPKLERLSPEPVRSGEHPVGIGVLLRRDSCL